MSSRSVLQFPSCPEEENRHMDCVYCKQRGPFLKNGVMMWGKHHVKFCCKAADRKKFKRTANRRKPTFTKEADGWSKKRALKNNKTRVTSGAKTVLKMSQDPFSVFGAIEAKAERKRFEQKAKEKRLKEVEKEKIRAAAAAKKVPRPSTKKPVAFGGWLAAAKTKKPVAKKPVAKVPVAKKRVVASPKRVYVLKKQAKEKSAPTLFKKGEVITFEEMKNMFSNTDSWGDSSDDEC